MQWRVTEIMHILEGELTHGRKKRFSYSQLILALRVVPGLYHAGDLNSNRVLTAFLASKTEVGIWSDHICRNVRVRS